MLAMMKRNLLLYFRNWSGVFFSLMGALISFVLYLVFLKKSMQGSWAHVPHATLLLDTWLIGGTLAITGITTTLTSLSQMVIDREKHITADLILTDAGPLRLQLSYLLSAALIGTLMQLAMFGIMLGYFFLADQLTVTVVQLMNVLGLMVSSSLLATAVNAVIIKGVRTLDSLSKLGAIVGTAAGFLVGTYVPIGILPTLAQTLVKLTPGSYVAALYRQFLMSNRLDVAFRHSLAARLRFEKLMGIRLDWSGLLTQRATYHIIGLIFVGAVLLAVGPIGLRQRQQWRRRHES